MPLLRSELLTPEKIGALKVHRT